MKTILKALQSIYRHFVERPLAISQGKVYYDCNLIVKKFTPQEVEANDERAFWEGLPQLGRDQKENSKLIIMIRNRHQATDLVDPYYNRRQLYKSLLYLRNESNIGWLIDTNQKRFQEDVRTVLDKAFGRNLRMA